jgi:murein DD-endopeptidase MepM/ murein hydrolase activator NlpD
MVFACVANARPEHSPWPGGIAILDLGTAEQARPGARFNERPVLVFSDGERWYASVGLPLSMETGNATLILDDDRRVVFEVQPHEYLEQRITVENQSYVDPSQEQLDRVFSERKIIDAALGNFRQQSLDDVSLAVPVPGPHSSSFGKRRFFNDQPRSPHSGMDIAANEGVAIKTPRDGIVTAIGNYFFNGKTVIVDHGQGLVTMYCHLSEIKVTEGDALSTGDPLGEVGATGRVTGAHLHFGTYLNSTAVDPSILLEPAL